MILTFFVTTIDNGVANCATMFSAMVGGGPVPSTQCMAVVKILHVGQAVCVFRFPQLLGRHCQTNFAHAVVFSRFCMDIGGCVHLVQFLFLWVCAACVPRVIYNVSHLQVWVPCFRCLSRAVCGFKAVGQTAMGFVAILRCQRSITWVDAFVLVLVQWACAVYVPRVVYSSHNCDC